MSTAPLVERLTRMTQPDYHQRFAALDQRRQELGVSIERLANRAGYKSDQTWRDLRNNKRPVSTLVKFEKALDWIEEHADEETGPFHVVAPSPDSLMKVEISGDFGVSVVVSAPIADRDALEEFARHLIREMRTRREVGE